MSESKPHKSILCKRRVARISEALPFGGMLPALYQSLIDNTTDAVICTQLSGEVFLWNKGAEKMYGYTADEMIGRHVSEIIPHDKIHELVLILVRMIRNKAVDHFQTERLDKDGNIVHVDVTITPLVSQEGNVVASVSVARDISAEIELRNRLGKVNSRLRELVDSRNNMIVRLDDSGIITYMNKRAREFYGCGDSEIIGSSAECLYMGRFKRKT